MASRGSRGIALALGLALVALLEGLLRVSGIGDPRERPDAFGAPSRTRPLFVPDRDAEGAAILRSERAGEPVHPTLRFLADKPAHGFRVFVLGGSSAAGTPYGYAHAFPELLRHRLAASLPGRHVEVVNAARPGFASRRLLAAAREIEAYAPDLLVLYSGHNEVLDRRLYRHLADTPEALFRLTRALRGLHLYGLLAGAIGGARGAFADEPSADAGEAAPEPALVRGFGAVAGETFEDVERQRFYALAAFRANVEGILHAARGAGARAVLVSQAKNTADWPVAQSRHAPDLSAAQRARFDAELAAAERAAAAGEPEAELAALRRAAAIDPAFAAVHQRLADRLRARGDLEAARLAYAEAHARSLDEFGTTAARNRALFELAHEHGALFVDVAAIFEGESPGGLVGWNWFVDFLHPNLKGQQRIADALADALRGAGVPEPAHAWRAAPPAPDPESLYRAQPGIRARELQLRIAAELVSGRPEQARRQLDALRGGWPGIRARELQLRIAAELVSGRPELARGSGDPAHRGLAGAGHAGRALVPAPVRPPAARRRGASARSSPTGGVTLDRKAFSSQGNSFTHGVPNRTESLPRARVPTRQLTDPKALLRLGGFSVNSTDGYAFCTSAATGAFRFQ